MGDKSPKDKAKKQKQTDVKPQPKGPAAAVPVAPAANKKGSPGK